MPADLHQLVGQPPTSPSAQPLAFKSLGERYSHGIGQRLASQGRHRPREAIGLLVPQAERLEPSYV